MLAIIGSAISRNSKNFNSQFPRAFVFTVTFTNFNESENIKMRSTPFFLLYTLVVHNASSMTTTQPWSVQSWCDSVRNPLWPFAYSKYHNHTEEIKGRTSTNLQDMRHVCETRGVRSKCHICEEIRCGAYRNSTCQFQIQGVSYDELSVNIPTVTDAPFVIPRDNGQYYHRYDYGGDNISHVCLHLTTGCGSSFLDDYSHCQLRCWGYHEGTNNNSTSNIDDRQEFITSSIRMKSVNRTLSHTAYWTPRQPGIIWEYPRVAYMQENVKGAHPMMGYRSAYASSIVPPLNPRKYGPHTSNPQGFSFTLAGSIDGEEGFVDGEDHKARFRHPEGLAVDWDGFVFVADAGNHAIRAISPFGKVTTLVGDGVAGSRDGKHARFSYPSNLAIWRSLDDREKSILSIFVVDTGNHRIRKISLSETLTNDGEKHFNVTGVECFAGLCANETTPQSGYGNGHGGIARFSSPRDIAVDGQGNLFVTDTNNHLIRIINASGHVERLAGSTRIGETKMDGSPVEGCITPCLEGNPGYRDGPFKFSKFQYPYNIAIQIDSGNKTLSKLIVTDRHFIRQLDLSSHQVTTIAGQLTEGESDGQGGESSFRQPSGVAVTSDGAIYVSDSVSCRIRRALPANKALPLLTCGDNFLSVYRPSGCSSYDPPTDSFGLMTTPSEGNIYRNYETKDLFSIELGAHFTGRGIKHCAGSPPIDSFDKKFWNETSIEYPFNENLVIDDMRTSVREDTNQGTLIKVRCPANCLSLRQSQWKVYGGLRNEDYNLTNTSFRGRYEESSSVCGAAIHLGIIFANIGGLVDIQIERSRSIDSNIIASFRNGIQSRSLPLGTSRLFSLRKGASSMLIQTLTGGAISLLENGCSFLDAIPAQLSTFRTPTGIAASLQMPLDNKDNFLAVSDRNNHAIRAVSATCSFVCENGGQCIGPDQCKCFNGWNGLDCTKPICETNLCGKRQLCVAPETCSCLPGFRGPDCTVPICSQSCENDGVCSAPDTCSCLPGWFDSNCTTPVCEQTCGNGGNCTSPNTCSCPREWYGDDCRIPMCKQECLNGGWCIAPNTCSCPPQWTGQYCDLPICHQGWFDNAQDNESFAFYEAYAPCKYSSWCNKTKSFNCLQSKHLYNSSNIKLGKLPKGSKKLEECTMMELGVDALSPFEYLNAWDYSLTPHMRYSPNLPYDWISKERVPWNAHIEPTSNFTRPWSFEHDRQVAFVNLKTFAKGKYVCANEGKCISPDVCACAKGWIGFDCRTPVCEGGFYEDDLGVFTKGGTNRAGEVDAFERFMGNNTYRLHSSRNNGIGYSNPEFLIWIESFVNRSSLHRYSTNLGNVTYLKEDGTPQGGYSCSIRSVTEWEPYRSGQIFEHPNFYSRYMNTKVEQDGKTYTFWEGMEWEPTHYKTPKLVFSAQDLGLDASNASSEVVYVYTDHGYQMYGEWLRTGIEWKKGSCIVEFNRTCQNGVNAKDVESLKGGLDVASNNLLVQDTDLSFRPRFRYDDEKEYVEGLLYVNGEVCVDEVIRGCFNNGTCVAPNTCRCSAGWTGQHCEVPICEQTCLHNGNCTLPNICTCAKGWSGIDCSIPICSQTCHHGYCIAPDTCACEQWNSVWRDGRSYGGAPVYQKPNGDAQLTGWTGYDCSTPICSQAETFHLNVIDQSHGQIFDLGNDHLACSRPECMAISETKIRNDGRSYQIGCGYDPVVTGCCEKLSFPNDHSPIWRCHRCMDGALNFSNRSVRCGQNESYQYIDPLEVSSKFHDVNGNIMIYVWEQGNFIDATNFSKSTESEIGFQNGRHVRSNFENYILDPSSKLWSLGPRIYGEGVFACFNGGSCIAPDLCFCPDGYTGHDCSIPLCRHKQVDGNVVGCLNGGLCLEKDICQCIQTPSMLWLTSNNIEHGLTGYTGSDCSMPLCVQGFYDPHCTNVKYAAGGEGCYRCLNGGFCVAPDVCQCAPGYTGFDCSIPVCTLESTPILREQLMTEDEDKIRLFEQHPCSLEGIYEPQVIGGIEYKRGVCVLPNKCACLCKGRKDDKYCKKFGGIHCKNPFQDPLFKNRNVLRPNELFGTRDCWSGYEGLVDENDNFVSCHMTIYEPDYFTEHTVDIILWSSVSFIAFLILFWCIRRKFVLKHLSKRIARRKNRRDSIQNAFTHREQMPSVKNASPPFMPTQRPGTATSTRARHTFRSR